MHPILENLSHLEPLAIGASAFAIVLVNFLWISQPMFGRAWIRYSGIRPGDIRPAHARRGFILSCITALFVALLLGLIYLQTDDTPSLLFTVGFIWLFIMFQQLNAFYFRREPFALFLLVTFRSLASLLAGAAVYTFWG